MDENNKVVENKDTLTSRFSVIDFVRRFIVFIVIITILSTLAGFGIAVLKDKPLYTARKNVMLTMKIVQQNGSTETTNNISLAQRYLPNVKENIGTPLFVDYARNLYDNANEFNGRRSGSLSAGRISVGIGEESLIFSISYSDYNEQAAKDKLECVIESASYNIKQPGILVDVEEVSIVPMQNFAAISSRNSFSKYIISGFMFGLIISFGISLLIVLLDNTVTNKDDLESITGASVLGMIEWGLHWDRPKKKNKISKK